MIMFNKDQIKHREGVEGWLAWRNRTNIFLEEHQEPLKKYRYCWLMGQSLVADGGSHAGTGYPHWSGTSNSVSMQLLLNISTGLQGGESLDNLKVGDGLQLRVLRGVEILLCHHNSLFEEVLVDGNTILLGHQHPEVLDLTSLVEVNQAN